MKYTYSNEQHDALTSILDARNRKSITPDMPLWKLKLTEEYIASKLIQIGVLWNGSCLMLCRMVEKGL